MVELGFPELSPEQIEILCSTAEEAARKYIQSKISSKLIEKLDIGVEAEGSKPVSLTVEIDLALNSQARDINAEELVKEATSCAHAASEKYLRKLK